MSAVTVGSVPMFPEYEPYEPEFGLARNVLTPARARRAFAHDMEVKDQRLASLGDYADAFDVVLGYDDTDIQRVYEWLAGLVTLDERVDLTSATTGPADLNAEPLILDSVSAALAWDFGLFLGEAVIHRQSSLGWVLGRGPRGNADFQRPVVGNYVHANGYVDQ